MKKKILKISLILSLTALALFFNSDLADAGAPVPVDYTFDRDIRFGERSKDAEYLQIVLSYQPDYVYPEQLTTGFFSSLTQEAVKRFQNKYSEEILAPLGLTAPTGYVGSRTRARLNEILDTFDAYNPSIPWFEITEEPPTYEDYTRRAPSDFLIKRADFEEIDDYEISGIPRVAVIVNSQLSDKINNSLVRYFQDLNEEGYSVLFTKWRAGKPTELRSYLQEKYNASAGLVGAVFIGELPVAWYELEDDFYNRTRDFPIDLYYMDMAGIWRDTNNDGKFNERSGNNRPDIWMGRLTAHNLTLSGADEVSLLQDYFSRNHNYRTGELDTFPQALSYVDDDWNHRATNSLDLIYDEVVVVNDKYGTNASDYKNNRLPKDYDFIHVMVHSSPSLHHFYAPAGSGGLVWNSDVKTIDQQAYFYNLFACSNARYTTSNYMGGWYIFSGNGLAAVGSTKIGSMLAFQDFYGPLGQGKTLGEAYKEWWQGRNPDSWGVQVWHFGMTLLGDPTLKIQTEEKKDTHSLSVNSSPIAGISVTSAFGHSGTTNYTRTGISSGTLITLTAPATHITPTANYDFTSWSGTGCLTTNRTVSFSITSSMSCTANYKENILAYTLSVTKSGTGSGTVTSNPAGISCGATCSAAYQSNTSVTLTPTASSDSTFKGWSGACTGTGTCIITMDSNKSVKATFDTSEPVPDCTTYNGYLYCRGFKSTDPQGSSCQAACSERGYTCPTGDSMFRSLSDIVNVVTTLGLLAPGESYYSRAGSYSTSYIRNTLSIGRKDIYYNSGWNQSCTFATPSDSSSERVNLCRCEDVTYPYSPSKILHFNQEKNSGWFYIAQTIPSKGVSFWAAAVRWLSTQPVDTSAYLLYGITDINTGEYYSGFLSNGYFSEDPDSVNLFYQQDGQKLIEFQQTKEDLTEFKLTVNLPWGKPNFFQATNVLALNRPLVYESGDGVIPMTKSIDSLYVSLPLEQGFWADFQKFNIETKMALFESDSPRISGGTNHRWGNFMLDESVGSLPAGTVGVYWEILDANDQRQPGGFTNFDLLVPGKPQMTAEDFQIETIDYWDSGNKTYLKKWRLIQKKLEVDLIFETLIPDQENSVLDKHFYEGMVKIFDPADPKRQVGTGMLEQTHDEKKPEPCKITCATASGHCAYKDGCKLLLHYDTNKNGEIDISETLTASNDYTQGKITEAERDFIIDAWLSNNINAKCSGCYLYTPCDNYGDVNQDGKLDETDVSWISQHIAGTRTFTQEQRLRADLNQDGQINVLDLTMLKQYLDGNIAIIPACHKSPPCGNYGDLTGSGFVNFKDAGLVIDCIFEKPSCTAEHRLRADVNNDGKVDVGDIISIRRYVSGLDSTFKVCEIAGLKTMENQLASLNNILSQLIDSLTSLIRR